MKPMSNKTKEIMKKIVNFLICLIFSIMAIGQNETRNLKVDLEGFEKSPPKFTGNENGAAFLEADNLVLKDYLLKHVISPKLSDVYWREGTEIVQFIVTPSGNISDFKVINSVCPAIDMEMFRLLKTTNGMWKPGYMNGEPTAMEKEVSILFVFECLNYDCIEVEKHFTNQANHYLEKGNSYLLAKNNPKKALKLYNKGVRYRPDNKELLMRRGMCNYELGDAESAKRDWYRIAMLGGCDPGTYKDDLTGMKGYYEMTDLLAHGEE
jgi:tetratricopeptide (TPR) repeat protein